MGHSEHAKADLKVSQEGALPLRMIVLAKFSETGGPKNDWRRAEIVEVRPKKDTNKKNEYIDDFDYYVHYIKYNRRLDCWIKYEDILLIDNFDNSLAFSIPNLSTTTGSTQTPSITFKRRRGQQSLDPIQVSDLNRIAIDIENALDDSEAEHEGLDKSLLEQHKECTKVKTINKVQIGTHLVEAWYFSPFPAEFQNKDIIYFCEFCLAFFAHGEELSRHSRRCAVKYPPGDEIYRDGNISVFEIDGFIARTWCENLCFLSKLFLDHKTLQFDTEPFLFYVLCETDDMGCHIVGYFSKEKFSRDEYNLACILTLPQHQRKGYGKFLISFSYELSMREERIGTPERPLSDLGRASYRAWWMARLLDELEDRTESISLQELSDRTAIAVSDIRHTFAELGVLRYVQGQHIIILPSGFVKKLRKATGRPGVPVKSQCLRWIPFLISSGVGSRIGSHGGYPLPNVVTPAKGITQLGNQGNNGGDNNKMEEDA